MTTNIDLAAAARTLYGSGTTPPPAPVGPPSPSKNLGFDEAAKLVYADQPAPAQELPTSRDLNGISVFGSRDDWREEILGRYGADLDIATRLAARGLLADSADPAAARRAIGEHGITPREFRRLVEIGAALRTGSR